MEALFSYSPAGDYSNASPVPTFPRKQETDATSQQDYFLSTLKKRRTEVQNHDNENEIKNHPSDAFTLGPSKLHVILANAYLQSIINRLKFKISNLTVKVKFPFQSRSSGATNLLTLSITLAGKRP